MNPLKRLKLKSQLRNCDYVLAGTVIKQQYYDPAKPTVINGLIDEFMANPNFENALKLIEYNEMLTFYFTESCAGGLYVRKSAQDSSASPQRQPSPDDDSRSSVSSGTSARSRTHVSGSVYAGAEEAAVPADSGESANPAQSADTTAKASAADPAAPHDPYGLPDPDEDPKRRLRRLKQQEILQESEALMEQLLSLDHRRRRAAGMKEETGDAASRAPNRTGERASREPGSDGKPDAETRRYRPAARDGRSAPKAARSETGTPPFPENAVREAAPTLETDFPRERPPSAAGAPAGAFLGEDAARSGTKKFPDAEPDRPKPAWARKPYSPDDTSVPDEDPLAQVFGQESGNKARISDAGAVSRGREAEESVRETVQSGHARHAGQPAGTGRESVQSDRGAHEAVRPERSPGEPPPHRLPKRSYANVIATLKIDIHTMATQLEDCRRKLAQHPANEQQLIAWINALEDAIEEFSQVVDHLEECQ